MSYRASPERCKQSEMAIRSRPQRGGMEMNHFSIQIVAGILSLMASPSLWAATDLVVEIQGEQQLTNSCSSAPCEIVLSDNNRDATAKIYYSAGITIAGADGMNPAKVVTTDGGAAAQDELILQNALITTTAAPNTRYIYFRAQFSAGDNTPSAPPLALIRWERKGKGKMIRGAGAPPGNWTQVHGLISSDPIQTATRKTVLPGCTAAACGAFDMSKTEDDYSLTGVRELRGELQFYMSTGSDRVQVDQHYTKSLQLGAEDQILERSGVQDIDDDDEIVLKGKAGRSKR